MPRYDQQSRFLQIYFTDLQDSTGNHLQILNRSEFCFIVKHLARVLQRNNPHIQYPKKVLKIYETRVSLLILVNDPQASVNERIIRKLFAVYE